MAVAVRGGWAAGRARGDLPDQAALFASLSLAGSAAAFGVLGALVLFCYHGSSGTMAATTADLFGSRHVGAIYGLMLTAWGFGGVLGPLVAQSASFVKKSARVRPSPPQLRPSPPARPGASY